MAEKKIPSVVVIGAGYTGSATIIQLQKHSNGANPLFSLTVIDLKDYFENNIGAVRAIVVPDMLKQTTVEHRTWLAPSTKLIVGQVTDVQEHIVTVSTEKGNEVVNFDYLVIVSGSCYNAFKSTSIHLDARKLYLENYADKITNAKSILLVGGGPVGLEIAGEIIAKHPNKNITLVHNHERFLDTSPNPKAHAFMSGFIAAHPSIKVILGDSVNVDEKDDAKGVPDLKEAVYRTRNGVEIHADLVIITAGVRPNSAFLRPHLANVLDAKGWIKVNRRLQVEGYNHIFAAGDIAQTGDLKLAGNQKSQPGIVTANIVSLINKKEPTAEFASEKSFTYPIVTTFGPTQGVGILPICGGVTNTWGMWAKIKTSVMLRLPPNL